MTTWTFRNFLDQASATRTAAAAMDLLEEVLVQIPSWNEQQCEDWHPAYLRWMLEDGTSFHFDWEYWARDQVLTVTDLEHAAARVANQLLARCHELRVDLHPEALKAALTAWPNYDVQLDVPRGTLVPLFFEWIEWNAVPTLWCFAEQVWRKSTGHERIAVANCLLRHSADGSIDELTVKWMLRSLDAAVKLDPPAVPVWLDWLERDNSCYLDELAQAQVAFFRDWLHRLPVNSSLSTAILDYLNAASPDVGLLVRARQEAVSSDAHVPTRLLERAIERELRLTHPVVPPTITGLCSSQTREVLQGALRLQVGGHPEPLSVCAAFTLALELHIRASLGRGAFPSVINRLGLRKLARFLEGKPVDDLEKWRLRHPPPPDVVETVSSASTIRNAVHHNAGGVGATDVEFLNRVLVGPTAPDLWSALSKIRCAKA